MLDFYRRHPSRCLLVSTNALLRQPPDTFEELLAQKLGIELEREALQGLYQASLLSTSAPDDPLVGLVAATSPDVIELLEQC